MDGTELVHEAPRGWVAEVTSLRVLLGVTALLALVIAARGSDA
jgi:hypothetical protein